MAFARARESLLLLQLHIKEEMQRRDTEVQALASSHDR